MDSAAAAADPMVRGNISSESNEENGTYRSMMESMMADSYEEEKEQSYPPLSFYKDSAAVKHGSIFKVGNNSSSLQFVTVYYPNLICMENNSSELKAMGSTAVSHAHHPMDNKVSRNSIPDVVAFSILSKLSIKALKRFESVSKSWSILFDNSDFIHMYHNHFISHHASENSDYHTFLLIHHRSAFPGTPGYAKLHLPDNLPHNTVHLDIPPQIVCQGDISILGSTSVNGIFCFGKNYPSKNKVQYVLWNPATKEFRLVPPSLNERRPHYPHNDLYLEHQFHGFGYDQVRHDFKLIQYVSFVSKRYISSRNFLEIYSLNSDSWRMINTGNALSRWSYPGSSFAGEEVYVDGVCHWLVMRADNNVNTLDYAITLLSFDLSHELFITTPIGEESYSPYSHCKCLAVLNGSIALISNYHDDIVFHISILGELGVSESWIKLYVYGPLSSIQWPPIGLGKTGYLFFKNKDGELAYVDLSTKIIKEVGITCGQTTYCTVGLYKESLYSIGGSRK